MDRVLLTAFVLVMAGIMLAGVWVFVAYGGATFEVFQDRVTGWVQDLRGG
ncbi:MAG: hypothetical protein L0Y50_04375 [Beijerinckiaceae bacterium]|nr:hypothetical protein [Beijerinckiaceae bacterium]MCI0735494.1 hypothetical protein [Beijerinckiaceae bacterium]